jgi:AbrB family looped-hinge helix DNA binding protein
MSTASLTSKGQITLPISIRKKLRLNTGDQVVFIEREDGEITVKAKKGNLMDLKGSLRWTGKPATIEEMDEAIASHVAEDDARIVREYALLSERGRK